MEPGMEPHDSWLSQESQPRHLRHCESQCIGAHEPTFVQQHTCGFPVIDLLKCIATGTAVAVATEQRLSLECPL